VAGRILEVESPEQLEVELAADRVRRGVVDRGKGVEPAVLALGPAASTASRVASPAIPRPWNSGSTDQPVSQTVVSRQSFSQ
jgi:hypothetical protein